MATTPGGQAGGQPARNPMTNFVTFFILLLAIMVLFNNDLRNALGQAVGYVFMPLFGFDYQWPVLTLVIAGLIMSSLTIVIRHFFTDYVKQAENQKITSAFNAELRKARMENNTFKMKKLTEMQPQIMQRSMQASATQMKLMPVTMLIVIPIFAWLAVFMGNVHSPIAAVPWSYNVDLNAFTVFPNWVLLYSLITIPCGQILSRSLRYYDFRKRLNQLAAEGKA